MRVEPRVRRSAQAERMAENAELAKALRAAKAAGKGVHISY